jgi:hypothetical protein
MPKFNPSFNGSRPKKKKSPAKRRAKAPRKRPPSAQKELPVPEETPSLEAVGRLERTRRLLLAALRVWELKRRVRD